MWRGGRQAGETETRPTCLRGPGATGATGRQGMPVWQTDGMRPKGQNPPHSHSNWLQWGLGPGPSATGTTCPQPTPCPLPRLRRDSTGLHVPGNLRQCWAWRWAVHSCAALTSPILTTINPPTPGLCRRGRQPSHPGTEGRSWGPGHRAGGWRCPRPGSLGQPLGSKVGEGGRRKLEEPAMGMLG